MSDYLANLAAKNIGGTAAVRPRVPGIYEPPALAASPWFGDIGDRENLVKETADTGDRNDWASAKVNSLARSEQGREEAKNHSDVRDDPPHAFLPSSRISSVSEVSPIRDASEISLNRKETLPSDIEKETVSPERKPRNSPNTFDLVTFFQKNREKSREPQTTGSREVSASPIEPMHAVSFGETRTAETRDATEPRTVRGQGRPIPGAVEDGSMNESGTRGKAVEIRLTASKPAASNLFGLPRPRDTRLGDTEQIVAPATIRKETTQAESRPVIHESVSSRADPSPRQGLVISEAGAEVRGLEISKIASGESPSARLQAIWRERRPPIALLHRAESLAPAGRQQADRDLSNDSNPTVRVTIGRIEVRASAPPVSSSSRERAMPPVMGLKEYLRQRTGRRGK